MRDSTGGCCLWIGLAKRSLDRPIKVGIILVNVTIVHVIGFEVAKLATRACIRLRRSITSTVSIWSLDNSELLTRLVRSHALIVLLVTSRLILVIISGYCTAAISLVVGVIIILGISFIFVDHIMPWLQEVFAVLVLSLVDAFTINIEQSSDLSVNLLHLLVCLPFISRSIRKI